MVFVAVVGPCLVARGPSAAFPEEVGAAGAFLEEVRLVAAAEEEAFPVEVLPSAAEEEAAAPLPCRVAGRTSRPGSFAYARRVSRAAGSFAGAAALRCVGGCARTPRRLERCAGDCLRGARRTASPDGLDFAGPTGAALAPAREAHALRTCRGQSSLCFTAVTGRQRACADKSRCLKYRASVFTAR